MTEHDIIQALGVHLYLKYICISNVLMFGDNCAEYEDGRIYAWRDGMTSWSLKSCDDDNIAYIHWEHAKLADDTNK